MATAAAAPAAAPGPARRFSSRALFDGHRELLIEHEGEIYRLRHTRGGKLILNK
jgi:hemin uptake protein HemP